MAETTIRATLKTLLEGVSNIGVVHDYERWAATIPAIATAFETTVSGSKVVRGWTISCQAASAEWLTRPDDNDDGFTLRTYTYKIRGYVGLNDANASEKTAFALALAVMGALDLSTVLHGEYDTYGVIPPAQLTLFEARLFGSILCHYIEITQMVAEAIAV